MRLARELLFFGATFPAQESSDDKQNMIVVEPQLDCHIVVWICGVEMNVSLCCSVIYDPSVSTSKENTTKQLSMDAVGGFYAYRRIQWDTFRSNYYISVFLCIVGFVLQWKSGKPIHFLCKCILLTDTHADYD